MPNLRFASWPDSTNLSVMHKELSTDIANAVISASCSPLGIAGLAIFVAAIIGTVRFRKSKAVMWCYIFVSLCGLGLWGFAFAFDLFFERSESFLSMLI
jgi:hypothetical protein